MAQKRSEARADFQHTGRERVVRESGGDSHGPGSFGEIEQKDENAERFAEHAGDVGRADVAAAFLKDIDATRPGDEPAERQRPD